MFFRSITKKEKPAQEDTTPRHPAVVVMPVKLPDENVVPTFARPLRNQLLASALGDVVGYKMRPGRGDEPQGFEIHIVLSTDHPRALQSVGNMLDDMDAPVGSTIEFTETGRRHMFGRTEGMAVDLKRDKNWIDFAELCTDALGGQAIYHGSRLRGDLRTLYFYGENYAAMQEVVRRTKVEGAVPRRLT
ncbi:MAG: hypothetical protein AAGO57_01190 [Pseudomonadota bacterium]